MKIKLTSQEITLKPGDIRAMECGINCSLPEEYVEFLLTYNVGLPESNKIDIGKASASVSIFLGLSESKMKDIIRVRELYGDRIPEIMLPVAIAGGGNLFCMDLNTGFVYFWNHEEESDNQLDIPQNIDLVAKSFDEFLEKIMPYKMSDSEMNGVIINSTKTKPGFLEKFKQFT